jgi:DNA-binding MarR family transcriptional regulator
MDRGSVSELLGACQDGKRIADLLPKLPQGMKASHIHVIQIIYQLKLSKGTVRISDIGTALHVTNPSITRIVNELVGMKAVEKTQNAKDKRIFTVDLTLLGNQYYKKYIEDYHNAIAKQISGISEKDIKTAAGLMHEVYRILSKGKEGI